MPPGIEIQIDTQVAQNRLETLRLRFSKRTLTKLIGLRLLQWVNQNFRQGGAERPWAPLSPNTIAGRRRGRGAGGAQMLRDTGHMAQSFTPGAPDSLYEETDDFVRVGTADRKAAWHHFGTAPYTITTKPPDRRSRKNPKRPGYLLIMTPQGPIFRREVHHPGLPARPLLPSDPLARTLAEETLQAYVDQVARGAS